MFTLLDLWLPILLSAVFVFVVSSVLHMVLTYHRADYKRLPDEDATIAALRQTVGNAPPGYYFFPYSPSMKELETSAMQEKFRQGPVGMLTLRPSGRPKIAPSLVQWFLFSLVVSGFAACVAGRGLASGTPYMEVFCLVATAAFMAYGVGQIVDSIWKAVPWSNTVRALIDGLIYSLVTAGTFGWLWPR